MNTMMSLPVGAVRGPDGQEMDEGTIELDFAYPVAVASWTVAVIVAGTGSRPAVALFYGTFLTPEAAQEWAKDNMLPDPVDDDTSWTIVPISALPEEA